MAEVLGVIASGVAIGQVAATTGVAVLRLKQLLDDLRDVPRSVEDLMEQIECFDPALWELEQSISQDEIPSQLWNTPAATRSAMYCRKALGQLADLTDELSAQINSTKRVQRNIARFKAVLKKGFMSDLERRLERAVRMLQCAQQGYTIALVKQQSEIITSRILRHLDSPQPTPYRERLNEKEEITEPEQSHQASNKETRDIAVRKQQVKSRHQPIRTSTTGSIAVRANSKGLSAHVHPPWWLAGVMYAWSIQLNRSYTGWKLLLRSFPIRPRDHPVFRAAQLDDIVSLREMFANGNASPFDVAEDGNTLLHIAALGGAPEVLEFLVSLGSNVDRDERNHAGATVADALCISQIQRDVNQTLKFTHLLLKFGYIPEVDINIANGQCCCPISRFWEVFQCLQPLLCPFHANTPLQSRLWTALCLSEGYVERLKSVLEPDWSNDPDAVCTSVAGYPLIHTVTKHIGTLIANPFTNTGAILPPMGTEFLSDWDEFALDVIQRSDIHRICEHWYLGSTTPLTMLLRTICLQAVISKATSKCPRLMTRGLRKWLLLLEATGVNLSVYGARENAILQRSEMSRKLWSSIFKIMKLRPDGKCYDLLGFKYGSAIDDWDIWWDEPTDKYAGQFWNLVERSSTRMPGEWYDTESDFEDF